MFAISRYATAVDPDLPLSPVSEESPRRTPAPAWVALLAAWLGLLTLLASIALPFIPGSQSPRAELEHARPYSPADRFLPIPVYMSVAALFVAIVVFRQMRDVPRPLAQRVQAWVGIALTLLAIVVFYTFAALRAGPGH
jgi:hypothetical protein